MAEPSSVASLGRERGGGRYEVREQLAVGGMASIHRAFDRLAQREVAYKQLLFSEERSRARATALFEREYDALARLPHPNIVEVYDYGKDALGPYYVMELLTGSDLTAIAPLPFREACRIIRDIASALALVHSRRLIHRDVSPNNVRLTSDGRAKLIDFGALMTVGKPREIVGTPGFIAPECLDAVALDVRSDLYSLGAVAYWALTKRVPVDARSLKDLADRASDQVFAPSLHVPEIPKELDALVLSMLARDPMARPPSAAYLIDRLTAVADLPPELDERRVAFSYLAHPQLAGRRAAVNTLEAAVARANLGHGESVLVEGGSGLGRSALLESLVVHAQLSGAVVLRAGGEKSAGPFAIADKLIELGFTLYPELAVASRERRALLLPKPTHRARTNASPMELADRHALQISDAQATLIEVARRGPLVIVVDDLQLADSESLALLASLAQELEQHPIALIASCLNSDPRTLDPATAKLRATSRRVVLSALDESCMVELVESVFGHVPNTHRLAQWLHAQSGGVPGHALELARLLLRTGAVRYTLGTFTLPHDVDPNLESVSLSSPLLATLGDLDGDTHALAQMLALHDAALTPEQLASATDRSSRDVLLSLEALKSLGFVAGAGDTFTLSGSSLRAALKSTIDLAQQRLIHLRIGRALLGRADLPRDQRLAAALHLCDGGAGDEAASIVDVEEIRSGEIAARSVRLLEALLAVYRAQGRAKEQWLRLLIPLVGAGFYGDLAAQRRHIDEALELMSRICGLTLASKLRWFLGGKLALVVGILYASLRRAFTPKADRLNSVPRMIADFVGMVVAGAATGASSMDGAAVKRYVRWLEPLSSLPKQSGAYLTREYCLAIAETSAGDFTAASARYARLIPTLAKPVDNLSEPLRHAFYLGALNGRAQAEVSSATHTALELADELGRDPFFAPHAECARMAYHAHRGEVDRAETHRARAELLALRGGTSWSAVTVLTVRRAYSAMVTRDAIMLMQSIAELDRLSSLAPKLRACKALCEAWLEALRGRYPQALALYEQTIHTEDARNLSSWRVDRTLYATVLNEAGHYERAKRVCTELLSQSAELAMDDVTTMLPRQQIALSDARLGDVLGAAEQLDALIQAVAQLDNPLQRGLLHRERARVAVVAKDRLAFDQHFGAMKSHFAATRNPSLIQLADALVAEATQAGIRVDPSRSLVPPPPADGLDGSTAKEWFESERA
jgi:tetratricopeptide (TPR) repeat protein